MEVGPLNPIEPAVQRPKEGQAERAGRIESTDNRLIAESPGRARPSGDTVSIASRKADLKELQAKIGVGNIAKEAILTLINQVRAAKGGKPSDEAKAEIERAIEAKFNGEPVFNGKTTAHETTGGDTASFTAPTREQAHKWVLESLDDAARGEKPEGKAFKELNRFYEEVTKFTDTVKDDLKDAVGISNKSASRSMSRDINEVKESLREVYTSESGARRLNTPKEMAGKVVKLLK
jgi:hypothetical protein